MTFRRKPRCPAPPLPHHQIPRCRTTFTLGSPDPARPVPVSVCTVWHGVASSGCCRTALQPREAHGVRLLAGAAGQRHYAAKFASRPYLPRTTGFSGTPPTYTAGRPGSIPARPERILIACQRQGRARVCGHGSNLPPSLCVGRGWTALTPRQRQPTARLALPRSRTTPELHEYCECGCVACFASHRRAG